MSSRIAINEFNFSLEKRKNTVLLTESCKEIEKSIYMEMDYLNSCLFAAPNRIKGSGILHNCCLSFVFGSDSFVFSVLSYLLVMIGNKLPFTDSFSKMFDVLSLDDSMFKFA